MSFFGFGVRVIQASAGNLLNIFSIYDKNRPLWVICRAGKRPEITVNPGMSKPLVKFFVLFF